MLSRLSSTTARSILPVTTRVAAAAAVTTLHSARTYATLKEVERRLKSINNIEKITKTMKIVASTRLSKAQKAEAAAKKLDEADQQFFEIAKTKDAKPSITDAAAGAAATKELIIAISSDKGLCGSIHSSLAKAVRNYISKNNVDCDIVTIGDKMKMQLMRSHQPNIKLSFSGIGKDAPSFLESSLISSKLIEELDVANKYSKVSIFYNNPVSSLSFQSDLKPVYNPDLVSNSPNYNRFEIDSEGNLPDDLFEYNLTNQILSAMSQGYSAEISARRNAMDNASKNAADMINSYSIIYNRTRQAAITNELVDIITGASSLD